MKRLFLLFAMVVLACCGAQAQEMDSVETFGYDEALTAEVDSVEVSRLAACQLVAGEWQYSKPYVHADGTSVIGKLGKPIAKSKLKKGLDKAYKKIKLKKRWSSLTLMPDGNWEMRVLGATLSGSYSYDPEQERLTLRLYGVPMKSHTHRDGKKLYIAFDADRLLVFLRLISGLSHSDTLKALAFLSQNYQNVMVGFEMKQK